MVWQIGVEGHAIALPQLVALTVADEHNGSVLDERGLATAGLVHRRIVGGARCASSSERVAGELSALPGLRGGQYLVVVSAARVAAVLAFLRAHDRDGTVLVQSQELREAQFKSGGNLGRDGERWAGLPTLNLREHRGADTAARGEVTQ